MAKDTNFKFVRHAPRVSHDTTLEIFIERGAWLGSRDPQISGR